MPTVTKRRRATKRPAEPSVPNGAPYRVRALPSDAKPGTLLDAPRNIEYEPQLANWTTRTGLIPDGSPKPFTATVCDESLNMACSYHGHDLFTVSFNPLFGEEAANRMLRLIAHAPDLWRMLRERAKFLLIDDIEEFGPAAVLLRDSAYNVYPFDVPENTDGESIACQINEQSRELVDERWRRAMNTPHVLTSPGDRNRGICTRFFCAHCGHPEWIPSAIVAHTKNVHGIVIDVPSGEVSRG